MDVSSFDVFSDSYQADPYGSLRKLAARAGVSRTRTGLWLVGTHAYCAEVLRDRRFATCYASTLARTYGPAFDRHLALRCMRDSFVVRTDNCAFDVRKHFARALAPARLRMCTPALRQCAARVLDAVSPRSSYDFAELVAAPFVLEGLSAVLGIPQTILAAFPPVSKELITTFDFVRIPSERLRQIDESLGRIYQQLAHLLQSPDARESELLAGLLQVAEARGQPLEITIADLLFVMLAAFETTSSFISHAALFLAGRPDVVDELEANPAKISAAVDELARLYPSIHVVSRSTSVDVDLGGARIQPRDIVLVLLAGANRDPAAFADPDNFDMSRSRVPASLAFGAGAHACIGASLARHFATTMIEAQTQQRRAAGSARRARATWRRLGVFRSVHSLDLQSGD